MAAATRQPLMIPSNETDDSTMSRITREGKKLSYKLTVLQQPERARACGAGVKSSADRRPVDPPPVVELRILESDPNDDLHKTDVTFAYNANFFLFATIESARPVASGKSSTMIPVLTGVPVAGIAYLDRPSQAGYFIFPDLSVRHEGRYRLRFHLFEETKDPKDTDKDALISPPQGPLSHTNMSRIAPPQNHMRFRLDVRSNPFTVYSAKKFPGLATSTSLSRIIAEQGCRVRIRRDVRMRRRGEKRKGEGSDYDEERLYRHRSSRYATPDAYTATTPIERPRSTSNGAVEHLFAYSVDAKQQPQQQRSSMTGPGSEYGYPCQQPYRQRFAPPAPPAPPAPTTHSSSFSSRHSFGPPHAACQSSQLSPAPQPVAPPAAYPRHQSYAHVRDEPNGSDYELAASVACQYQQSRPAPEPSPVYPKTFLPPLPLEPSKPLQLQPFAERRSSDPNAHQSTSQYPASRSQTPSDLMPSLPPSLPPLKCLSADFNGPSPQPLSSLPRPSIESTPAKRHLYETGPILSKRSHAESFGHEDYGAHNGACLDNDDYPNMRRKYSNVHSGVLGNKDLRSEMYYKRANGKMTTKFPTVR